MLLAATVVSAAETGGSPGTATAYRYVLLTEHASENPFDLGTLCRLYVAGPKDHPLHGGSIAVELPVPGAGQTVKVTALQPDEKFELRNFDGAVISSQTTVFLETIAKKTAEGKPYLGFTWNIVSDKGVATSITENAPVPLQNGEGCQHIADFTVSTGAGQLQSFRLLPWVETPTGAAILKLRKAATGRQAEIYESLMRNFWRYDTLDTPTVGYYQGYYEADAADGTGQRQTDILNGWSALQVKTYRPQSPLQLTVTTPAGAILTASYDGGHGNVVGKVTDSLKFEDLTFKSAAKSPQTRAEPEQIPIENGFYTLQITKESHTTVTCTGLTASAQSLFPQLAGQTIVIPCGDLSGDGRIKQLDRALLTKLTVKGMVSVKTEGKYEPYDLNGDHKISQLDLAIQLDPTNYGRSPYALAFEAAPPADSPAAPSTSGTGGTET